MWTTLVGAEILRAHLDDPDWVVVDCRHRLEAPGWGRRAWAAGHVPGAVHAHLDEDLSGPRAPGAGRHPLPDPAALARRLGAWGIDERCQVVAYDDAGGTVAARLWWLLRWLGHRAVAVLDGGWQAWLEAGGPVETAAPAPVSREFAPAPRPQMTLDTEAVVDLLGDPGWRLVDARSPERFRGEREPHDPVAGHVPGAVNRPCAHNLDPFGRFLPPEALRAAFREALGPVPPERSVHYCGSGVTACHNLLAMAHAGLDGGRLWPGSWSAWVADPTRPVARG